MTPQTAPIDAAPINCLRCGRKLRAAKSRANRLGPVCKAKVGAAKAKARLEDYSARQILRAEEIIELGGLVPAPQPDVMLAVSTSGAATYLVCAKTRTCTCKAGANGQLCYHLAAAEIWGMAA